MSPDLSTVFHKRWGIKKLLLILKALVYDDKVQILRVWFSGRTRPCQGRDRVSITLTRTANVDNTS